jgi:hypothetical protein
MKKIGPRFVASAIAIVFLAGCAATTGVVSKGDDLYTINVYRGEAAKVKLRAHQRAQKFCAQTGSRVQVVNENLRADTTYASQTSSIIDLDFKCVK